MVQAKNGPNPFALLSADTRIGYSISTNATANVSSSGWGISADYLLPAPILFTDKASLLLSSALASHSNED